MSKQPKQIGTFAGCFLGWGDERLPHRQILLATASGQFKAKVAKKLRSQIQDWQPGMWLSLLGQQRIDPITGKTKIKIQQLLMPPTLPGSVGATASVREDCQSVLTTTRIQICQGSSCRRKGSSQICKTICTYLADNNLTDRAEIEMVKCLHQCGNAPVAVFARSTGSKLTTTYYRKIRVDRLQSILARQFPLALFPPPIVADLIERLDSYLERLAVADGNRDSLIPAPFTRSPRLTT